jgi:hypothetical protein
MGLDHFGFYAKGIAAGKNHKTKKDCRQSFLCCIAAENYSAIIAKVRQGGNNQRLCYRLLIA